MITADVRRAAWEAARDAVAAGELPAPITSQARNQPDDASTLRHVPPGLGGGPGRYASTLPYLFAGRRTTPHQAAAVLAGRLATLPWVAEATAAAGHLSVTVTEAALTGLAVRIPSAGDCARSEILRGLNVPAPVTADLATATSWREARGWLGSEIACGLAAEAGAKIFYAERLPPTQSAASASATPIQAALAYAGRDAVRYALISRAHGAPERMGASLPTRHHLANPVYAVRYAHAHAASTLRQAADLGISRGEAAEAAPRLLSQPQERALLGAMSWLPERVAWAARRGRPDEFARYLEELASTYHDCRENCPALPFGGHRASRDPDTIRARLWLVTAARTAIAAGLGLLGVSAPTRL